MKEGTIEQLLIARVTVLAIAEGRSSWSMTRPSDERDTDQILLCAIDQALSEIRRLRGHFASDG
jgi:hypothetical protein